MTNLKWRKRNSRSEHPGWTVTTSKGVIDIFAWDLNSRFGECWRWVFIPTGSYRSTICGFSKTVDLAKTDSVRECGIND